MVVVLLQPFSLSPNLFCSTSLYAQLTLYRSKGWWKLTKLYPASLLAYEALRSFFHHNHFLLSLIQRNRLPCLKVPLISQERKDHLNYTDYTID